jgi:transposase
MRTDSTHIVTSIRGMNRLGLVGKTLRVAINVISTVDPTWLSVRIESDRYLRYAKRFERGRLPKAKDGIIAAAEQIGRRLSSAGGYMGLRFSILSARG